MFYRPFVKPDEREIHYLSVSRVLVIFWGLLLAVTAWQLSQSQGDLITLAFSMTTYTLGPMLGLFILSLLSPRLRVGGIAPAVCISVLAVLILNEPELFTAIIDHSYTSPLLAWPWLFPIGTLVCIAVAIRGRRDDASSA